MTWQPRAQGSGACAISALIGAKIHTKMIVDDKHVLVGGPGG